MPPAVARLLWRLLALLSLALGALGVVLPVLPTVPFLLLAAWAAGKGWPALETWLSTTRISALASAAGVNEAQCRAGPSGWPA